MKKIILTILSIIAIVVAFNFDSIYYYHKFGFSISPKGYKKYLPLLADSVVANIDTLFSASFTNQNNTYSFFSYRQYSVSIWDFKTSYLFDLRNLSFAYNSNLEYIEFKKKAVVDKHSDPEITLDPEYIINKKLKVKIDSKSKDIVEFSGNNYKGFYGRINKVSFSDEFKENWMLYDFSSDSSYYMLFMLYKSKVNLYNYIVMSHTPIDTSGIKFFKTDY